MNEHDVHRFWFGDDVAGGSWRSMRASWFGGGPAFDDAIRERFGPTIEAALTGALDGWAGTATGRLSLVIVLDQFTRNVYRGSGRAFAGDARALALAREGVANGHAAALSATERSFLLMPFMHAEALAAHDEGVAAFEQLLAEVAGHEADVVASVENNLKYARTHREVVARFGRYPHRNALLGRPSTPDEAAYLAGGAETWGQSKSSS
jgi:uncharacterized protein (DUF924 family)